MFLFLGQAGVAIGAAAPQLQPLVDVQWLAAHVDDENLVIVDIRSVDEDDEEVSFAEGHIPGSVHSGYSDGGWRTKRAGIVAQLPPVHDLEIYLGELGIKNSDTIVIVAAGTKPKDFAAAAWVYWTFNVLGHKQVSILNGGYRAWVHAQKKTVRGEEKPAWPSKFTADFQP
ncbi:MAG: hypothetical protein L0H83_11335, partial [Salinisphaera sp.]|nr:hypothetical protein [Salinisphaera sp.]